MGENTGQKTKDEQFHSCGLWPMASYINHCCYSNARRAFIGDMMVVRATQDIAPDTEITFWYQAPAADSYSERQKKLRHWGFKCSCAICRDDQTAMESVVKRRGLKAEVLKYVQLRNKTAPSRIETLLATMAKTYRRPAAEVPRLSIWDLQLSLAGIYMQQDQPKNAVDSALRALQSLGYVIDGGNLPRILGMPMVIKQWGVMMDSLVNCWMLLSAAYKLVAPDLEAQAERYARISYSICVGEDETFEDSYGKLGRYLI